MQLGSQLVIHYGFIYKNYISKSKKEGKGKYAYFEFVVKCPFKDAAVANNDWRSGVYIKEYPGLD